jgi:hypothetical protein
MENNPLPTTWNHPHPSNCCVKPTRLGKKKTKKLKSLWVLYIDEILEEVTEQQTIFVEFL